MRTLAPSARAPARRQRSILNEASAIASRDAPRTRPSYRTSSGVALAESPPEVMMPCRRTESLSLSVSRWVLTAFRATIAAWSALTPLCGDPPAWDALPMNLTYFTRWPLFLPPPENRESPGLDDVCTIIAMSTSSNAPRRMNSCLPERRPSFPLLPQPPAVLDVDELLRRHGHQHHAARERTQYLGGRQRGGRAPASSQSARCGRTRGLRP